MNNNQLVDQVPDPTTHLKNVYEQSLAVLSESRHGRSKKQPTRLLHSSVPLHIDAVSLQKRALNDAAKALATLWKVPSHGQARLCTR